MPTTMRMMFPTIWKIMWVLMALYAAASLLIVTAGGRLLYHPGDVIALTSILPRNDLFILDVPRRILRNLTHSAAIERGLRWSPDGEQLAYISDLYEIRTLPFMGKQTNRITIGTAYIRSLAWSLDGTRIFFTASDSGPVQLRSMSAKGEDVQAVPNLPLDYHDLTWSPDGQLLAFASLHEGDHAIYIMDWSSGEVQRLTERRTIDVSPAWSPDGRALVFSSVRSGRYEVDIYDLATGAGHAITTDQIPPRTPRWVGNRIVYASGTRIYAVNADGTDPRELADIGVEISALAVRP